MSLFISGLKLPKKGRYSTVTIYWDGRVVFKFGGAEAGKAIEIPPHGRLIEEPKQLSYGGLVYIPPHDAIGTAKYFLDQIKAMPTVIPAEEE